MDCHCEALALFDPSGWAREPYKVPRERPAAQGVAANVPDRTITFNRFVHTAGSGYSASVPASSASERPASLVTAAALTWLAAAFMAAQGVLALTARTGALSAGVGGVLLGWAAVLAWVGWAFFRGRRWSRGPLVAAALLHLASFAGFVPSQPLALIPAAVALATVVAAVWPSTTRAMHWDDTSSSSADRT